MTDTASISVRSVTKQYSKSVRALKGVSLEVGKGEIFGLLGRNGAGKTTLVKILLDIVRPTSGETRILGVTSRQPGARSPIGYLPEDHRFPDYRTAEQTLAFYAMLSGVSREDQRRRIPELLEKVDLRDAAKRKVRSYSKGMKQRLGLAQALVHDPQILFLDEPTDGVDPVGRARIRDLLVQLKDEGKTIFLNSHLLGEVEIICDRVAILEAGEVVRQGTIPDLTSTKGLIRIETVPAPGEDVMNELRRVATSASRQDGAIELDLARVEDVDRVVDLLRARSLSIRSLSVKRHSLEEVFLETIGSEADGHGAGRGTKGGAA